MCYLEYWLGFILGEICKEIVEKKLKIKGCLCFYNKRFYKVESIWNLYIRYIIK